MGDARRRVNPVAHRAAGRKSNKAPPRGGALSPNVAGLHLFLFGDAVVLLIFFGAS